MGIFGSTLNKKPMFGQVPGLPPMRPYDTPPIWGGPPAPTQPEAMPQKPKFFGQGGVGRDIAGGIGDYLLQMSGMQPIYAPNMLQQRDAEERRRMAEQQRMAGREDYVWKAQYERANPKPANNDTVNDLTWYKGLSDEDRKLYHQMKPVVGYMADGTPRVINPYEAQAPSAPKPGTIEDGHEFIGGDPSNPASWKRVGGPAASQPGNFRP